jgi:hypothetical protein
MPVKRRPSAILLTRAARKIPEHDRIKLGQLHMTAAMTGDLVETGVTARRYAATFFLKQVDLIMT